MPLREDASPTLTVGPIISLGKNNNKFNLHLSYGFAPRQTYSRDEIDLDTLYDGTLYYSEFQPRKIFEQTISIGVSWGFGS